MNSDKKKRQSGWKGSVRKACLISGSRGMNSHTINLTYFYPTAMMVLIENNIYKKNKKNSETLVFICVGVGMYRYHINYCYIWSKATPFFFFFFFFFSFFLFFFFVANAQDK